MVVDLASTYDGFARSRPLGLYSECGRCAAKRRIDLRKLSNYTMLCIWIDEAHPKTHLKTDEEHRDDDSFIDFNGKHIFSKYNLTHLRMRMVREGIQYLMQCWRC